MVKSLLVSVQKVTVVVVKGSGWMFPVIHVAHKVGDCWKLPNWDPTLWIVEVEFDLHQKQSPIIERYISHSNSEVVIHPLQSQFQTIHHTQGDIGVRYIQC